MKIEEDINMRGSAIDMPREPKFYPDESKLLLTNVPMPSVKPPKSDNGDRICNTCSKEDVCMYKGECAKAAKDISLIAERTNVFIDTDIRCKKWASKVSNYRGLE